MGSWILIGAMLAAAPALAQAKPKAPTSKAAAKAAEEEALAAQAAEEAAAAKAAADAAAAQAAEDAAKAAADAAAQAEKRLADEQAQARSQALSARGLDARVRALTDILAIACKRLPGDFRGQRFAVLPFEQLGPEVEERSLGLVVSDLILTDLAREHRLPLVERAALARVMDELALQQTGAVVDGQAKELGAMTEARALVLGTVSDVGDAFLLSARVVDTETAAVLVAEQVQLPKSELLAFAANSVVLRSRGAAAFRSAVLPGWGQAYNGDTGKAVLFGGVTGGLLLATAVTTGLGAYNGYVYYPSLGDKDLEGLPETSRPGFVEGVRTQANQQLTAGVILFAATAVMWGAGIADAWLSGTDVESLDAALARN
jgi:TolB-like protein